MNPMVKNEEVKRDSLKKSSFFNIIIKVVVYLLPLITTPYLYRTLSVTGVGTYSYQSAYVTYFMLIAVFGFQEYGTKEISSATSSREKMSERFWSIFAAQLLLGAACLIIYFAMVFAHVFSTSAEDLSYCLLSLFIISSSLDITFFFQGIEKFKSIAIRSLIVKLLNFILIFVFIHGTSDYIAYVLIMGGSTLVSNVLMFFPLIKYVNKPTFHHVYLFKDIRNSSLYFISALAITLYSNFSKTFLGIFYDNTQVGYYESTGRITSVIYYVAIAILPIIFSRNIYLLSQGKEEEAKGLINVAFNAIMDFVFPAVVGILCTSAVFVPWFFGEDDAPAVPMMMICCLALPFVTTSRIVNYSYFLPKNKIGQANILLLIVTAFSLLINYLLVRFVGPLGASYATLGTEAFSALLFVFFSRKYVDYKKVCKSLIKPFDAALVMGIFYYLFATALSSHNAKVVMILDVVLSMALYAGLLLLFKDDFFYPQVRKYTLLFKNKIKARKEARQK